jgi:hypothetical protein
MATEFLNANQRLLILFFSIRLSASPSAEPGFAAALPDTPESILDSKLL